MGNGESVNVVVFGEHALRGRVEVVNDRNTTIHFGVFGGWSVKSLEVGLAGAKMVGLLKSPDRCSRFSPASA